MIKSGSIIHLSNDKKYIITDYSIENGDIYYLTLEVDYDTEMPKDETVFFKQKDENNLERIINPDDVDFLKDVFVNKFLENYTEEN